MGIFSRMKRAVKSRANATIDRALDPAKELDMAIMELEKQQRSAYKDLLSYKTTAKQLDREIERLDKRAKTFEDRAKVAVKRRDDETARECLKEKKAAEVEAASVRRDRDEATTHAVELNKSRKKVETRLKILKMKKGTMANQIAAARSGTGNVFGQSDAAFDKLARAEDAIDEDAVEAEVQAALEGSEMDEDLDQKILAAAGEEAPEQDDELTQLKAKMKADQARKKLPGDTGGAEKKGDGGE